jgi:hypothetical protein
VIFVVESRAGRGVRVSVEELDESEAAETLETTEETMERSTGDWVS